MARMLGAMNPGYRWKCRYARKGCTCYYMRGSFNAKVRKAQKRSMKRKGF